MSEKNSNDYFGGCFCDKCVRNAETRKERWGNTTFTTTVLGPYAPRAKYHGRNQCEFTGGCWHCTDFQFVTAQVPLRSNVF